MLSLALLNEITSKNEQKKANGSNCVWYTLYSIVHYATKVNCHTKCKNSLHIRTHTFTDAHKHTQPLG